MKISEGKKWYTVEEIAAELRVSTRTIRRYLKSGKLQGHKLEKRWRISKGQYQSFLNSTLNVTGAS